MTDTQKRAIELLSKLPVATYDTLDSQDREWMYGKIIETLAQVEAETWEDRRGELWSFIRKCMSQGGDILTDYNEGKYQGYEEYSSRLDAAARERVEEWLRQQGQRTIK